MTTEPDAEIKAEHRRGYAKGYAAGKRRQDREISREEFRRAVFLAALPSYLEGTWERGGKRMTTTSERVSLAWSCADIAVKNTSF